MIQDFELLSELSGHYDSVGMDNNDTFIEGSIGRYYGKNLTDAIEQYKAALLSMGILQGGTEKSKPENILERNLI